MLIYCINMDKDVQRWDTVKESFNNLSCKENFKLNRISAVVGTSLNLDELNLSIRTRACFDEPRTSHETINKLAQIGCYLSHIKCWELFNNSSEKCVLICEDDVIFNNELCTKAITLWNNLESQYKDKPLMLMLNYVSIFYNPTYEDDDIMRANGRFFGTAAYIINKNAVNLLLEKCYPMEVQVDSLISFLAKLNVNDIHIFHTKNNLIEFQNVKSTINHDECKNCWLPPKYKGNMERFTILCVLLIVGFSIGIWYIIK